MTSLLRLLSATVLILSLAMGLPASDQVGDFRWARLLLVDAAQGIPATAIARNGDVESAVLVSENALGATIALRQFQGDNQAGTRSFGGNVLVGLPGRPYRIGLPSWDIRSGTDRTGQWVFTRKLQQDAKLRIGYAAIAGSSLIINHGDAKPLGTSQPYASVAVELPFRYVSNSTQAWQLAAYGGSPTQAGVWQCPPNTTMGDAQRDPANRLADLGAVLRAFSPGNGTWHLDFRMGAQGAWTLAVDGNGDGVAERTVTSADTGNRPTSYTAITGASGLMIASLAAGGNAAGYVGLSPMTLHYQVPGGNPTAPAAPVITPTAGTYTSTPVVTITAGDTGAIRYTLDGSDPGATSTLYTAPFTLGASATVRARVLALNRPPGAIASATYLLQVATPQLTAAPTQPAAPPFSVSAQSATSGATLRYTVDGTDPGASSPVLPSSLALDATATVSVRGFRSGFTPSAIARATYRIQPRLAFQIGSSSVEEPAGPATIRLRLSSPAATAITARVAIGGGTATAADHSFVPQTISFAMGTSETSISVPIVEDPQTEPAETLVFAIDQVAGAVVGQPATHTLTIVANEGTADADVVIVSPASGTRWIAGAFEVIRVEVRVATDADLQYGILVSGVPVFPSREDLGNGRFALNAQIKVPVSLSEVDLVVDVQSPALGYQRVKRTVPIDPWLPIDLIGEVIDHDPTRFTAVWVEDQPSAPVRTDGSFTLRLASPPKHTEHVEVCAARFDPSRPAAGATSVLLSSQVVRGGSVSGLVIDLAIRPGARVGGGTTGIRSEDLGNSTTARIDSRGYLVYGPDEELSFTIPSGIALTHFAQLLDQQPAEIGIIAPDFREPDSSGIERTIHWRGSADDGAVATWLGRQRITQVWFPSGGLDPRVVIRSRSDTNPPSPLVWHGAKPLGETFWGGFAIDEIDGTVITRSVSQGTINGAPAGFWWGQGVRDPAGAIDDQGDSGPDPIPYDPLEPASPVVSSIYGFSDDLMERLEHARLAARIIKDGQPVAGAPIAFNGLQAVSDAQGVAVLRALAPAPEATGARLFVLPAATGLGTGASWQDAFTSLDTALQAAEAQLVADPTTPVEIWLGAGTYRPTRRQMPSDPRSASFVIGSQLLTVRGGFAGNENASDQADPVHNPTILSGDIGVVGNHTDNARCVVSGDIINLQGVIVRDGRGSSGAGITAGVGCILTRCVVTGNQSVGGDGGGILTRFASLRRCLVVGNSAARGGGLAVKEGFTISLGNSVIAGNTATVTGSAIWIETLNSAWASSSQGELRQCTLAGDGSSPGVPLIARSGVARRLVLTACVLAPDATGQVSDVVPTQTECRTCVAPIPLPGSGNRVGTPVFRNIASAAGADGRWATADDGFALIAGSPGVDAVEAFLPPSTTFEDGLGAVDITLAVRSGGAAADAGAYELAGPDSSRSLSGRPRELQFGEEEGADPVVAPVTVDDPTDSGSPIEVPDVGAFPGQINVLPEIVLPGPQSIG